MIRAGKRETWKWEPHEIYELRRRLQQQLADTSNSKVILWAFDDSCLAHTKRRVISIGDVPEGTPETEAIVRSVADDAEELLAGLKRILRQILQACFTYHSPIACESANSRPKIATISALSKGG